MPGFSAINFNDNRLQAWFAAELNALKSSPEEVSAETPRLEPLTAATPYTPYLPQMPRLLPNEQLKLPLSKEMALSVLNNLHIAAVKRLLTCYLDYQAIPGTSQDLRPAR